MNRRNLLKTLAAAIGLGAVSRKALAAPAEAGATVVPAKTLNDAQEEMGYTLRDLFEQAECHGSSGVINGGGRYIHVGAGGRVFTSLDGVTWTHRETPPYVGGEAGAPESEDPFIKATRRMLDSADAELSRRIDGIKRGKR